MSDDWGWAEKKQERQRRHKAYHAKNMAILEGSGLPYQVTNDGETVCFRQAGKPKADFYPSTGRWRMVGSMDQTTRSGGAVKFLRWYDDQHV